MQRLERAGGGWRNGLLWLLPLLVWNLVMWPQLPAGAGGAEPVPSGLTVLEQALRVVVFAWPLWLRMSPEGRAGRIGLVLYLAGCLVYAVSWVPWLQGTEQTSTIRLLGPAVTPLVVFGAMATLGRRPAYLAAAVAFTAVHVTVTLTQAGTI